MTIFLEVKAWKRRPKAIGQWLVSTRGSESWRCVVSEHWCPRTVLGIGGTRIAFGQSWLGTPDGSSDRSHQSSPKLLSNNYFWWIESIGLIICWLISNTSWMRPKDSMHSQWDQCLFSSVLLWRFELQIRSDFGGYYVGMSVKKWWLSS